MSAALVLAGLAMGLAASPHCTLMCAAPCAAMTGGCRRDAAGFHLGRMLGYMAGGALAAGSVAALGAWSRAAPALRPIWSLLQLGFLALGLWWLATGRQPRWMMRSAVLPIHVAGRRRRTVRASLAGLAWVAWPCGALQGALLLSALGGSPIVGALVMAAFALGSMPALALAPWAWSRWQAAHGGAASPASLTSWGYRTAGLGLAMASGWALGHGMWERLAAWCSG